MNYRTNFNSSYANRGMALENDINETNKYYREYDIALIYKKPTPIKVLNVSYPNNKSHLIDKIYHSSLLLKKQYLFVLLLF